MARLRKVQLDTEEEEDDEEELFAEFSKDSHAFNSLSRVKILTSSVKILLYPTPCRDGAATEGAVGQGGGPTAPSIYSSYW